jgi:multidrug transporter EmrE-like cation transporter
MNQTYLLFLATIIAIMPIFLIKYYILYGNYIYIGLSILSYLLLLNIYIKLFSKSDNEISTLYVILQILQILIVVIFGLIFLKEKSNIKKIIGIIMGMISIYLLT